MTRNFIWGSTDSQRSAHLLKWSSLCQPKRCGGHGVKDLAVDMGLKWELGDGRQTRLALMVNGTGHSLINYYLRTSCSK
ncbi:hypothetical protein K1719_013426 [Acacia pycnantha]|nr:hypothetical protein K1719_013426 [Acacia pycnantha]